MGSGPMETCKRLETCSEHSGSVTSGRQQKEERGQPHSDGTWWAGDTVPAELGRSGGAGLERRKISVACTLCVSQQQRRMWTSRWTGGTWLQEALGDQSDLHRVESSR